MLEIGRAEKGGVDDAADDMAVAHRRWLARHTTRRGVAILAVVVLGLMLLTHTFGLSFSRAPEELPTDPLQRWGLTDEFPRLPVRPWPTFPPPAEPYSSLGREADETYTLGPPDPAKEVAMLKDVLAYFPDSVIPDGTLERLIGPALVNASSTAWDDHKNIWQTDKTTETISTGSVQTWSHGAARIEHWNWELITDEIALAWLEEMKGMPRKGVAKGAPTIYDIWQSMPPYGILHADLVRYILLFVRGGIYTDTDTQMKKAPSAWGRGAIVWKDGEGWLDATRRARLAAGEDVDAVLGRPSVVVGIEADVGDREDWHQWWPRPLQIVQWTIAAAPFHPITAQAIARSVHGTNWVRQWAQQRWKRIKALRAQGKWDEAEEAMKPTPLSEPSEGGPLGVMNWTGPGIWTDAVLSYLLSRYGMRWTDLRSLQRPLRVGDVVVLPVTGFSPGIGHFGAGEQDDEQAMVRHLFRGSWKAGPAFGGQDAHL